MISSNINVLEAAARIQPYVHRTPLLPSHSLSERIGVEVRLNAAQATEVNCLGTGPGYAGTDGVSATAVSAGTCMVSPHGCTMNFVFTDGV